MGFHRHCDMVQKVIIFEFYKLADNIDLAIKPRVQVGPITKGASVPNEITDAISKTRHQ